MREIKFRAWDRKEKEMIFDALEIGNFGLGDGSVGVDEKAQRGNELDWMQFTGLLDKNGKEMYEGDVVETQPGTDKRLKFLNSIERIEFVDGCFIVQGITQSRQWNDLYKETKRIEVIGNIYENPELLTNNKEV